MFFFNFLFWLSGVALIVVGALIRNKYGEYLSYANSQFANVAVLIIVIGIIVFVIGFLGCCGAVKENYCMVTTFAVLLALIFILEIVAGALGISYKGKVKDKASEALQLGLDKYGIDQGHTDLINFAQEKLKCCGIADAKDYNGKNGTCGADLGVKTCHEGGKCTNTLYDGGCKDKFIAFVQDNMILIGGVAIGIAFIQLLGIIFACVLMRAIKGEYEVV